jgi:hypothetical protein
MAKKDKKEMSEEEFKKRNVKPEIPLDVQQTRANEKKSKE